MNPDPTAKGALAIKEVDSYKLTIHFLVEDNTLDKDEDFGFLVPCLRKRTGIRFSKKDK